MSKFVEEFLPDPDWPETGTLPNGKIVVLAEVDGLVKAGKIKAADAHEIRIDLRPGLEGARPWQDAGYWLDDDGKVDVGEIVTGPIMTRSELAGMGYTDDKLEAMRAEYFGPPEPGAPKLASNEPGTVKLEAYRRKVWDAVMERMLEG
jgi:hypothetical protein